MIDLETIERTGWTWDELMEAPDDVVIDLRAKWAAEVEARRIQNAKRS